MKRRKQILKILIAIFFIIIFSLTNAQRTYAVGGTLKPPDFSSDSSGEDSNYEEPQQPSSIEDIMNAGSSWIETGSKSEGKFNDDYFANMFVGLGQVLVGVGVVTLLIVSAIMGIKWITAQPDQKAKLKQQLIGLIVAMVVIFGAIGIWNLTRKIMRDVEESMGTDIETQSFKQMPEETTDSEKYKPIVEKEIKEEKMEPQTMPYSDR